MSSSPNIRSLDGRGLFLIGFMGTGKSTVGSLLAARLQRPFVDLDDRIVIDAGATIPEIFAGEGEAGFRAREAAMLRRVTGEGALVAAIGGGAPCHGDNLDRLLAAGAVIGLTASVDEILQRVGDGESRPLLAGKADRRGEIERLLGVRTKFYSRAHFTVDTTARPPSKVVAEILAALGC
ncbi:MAG TPA: shikimate kinase [Polyangia bacterium]|nr:shikimate kinase [Polyangia bacterium]